METQLNLIAESLANQPELIKTFSGTINGVPCLLCGARELHSFLQVGKVFAAWIQERIKAYDFEEGYHFNLTVSKTGKRSNVIKKDYHLTLDMAKELSMVENNAKGREARRYFIEMEKRALAAMGQGKWFRTPTPKPSPPPSSAPSKNW